MRKVVLRAEVGGENKRNLWARLDDGGNLVLEGQDLGPATALVSDDGEYEWVETIGSERVPSLVELLGAQAGDDLLDVLQRAWAGPKSYELERVIRENGLRSSLSTWP
jgi:hypothetical protein